ncbi:MAG: hypothetical protein ACTHNU_18050 [Gaiellales bacterium]
MASRLTRRQLLAAGAALGAATLVDACGGSSTSSTTSTEPPPFTSTQKVPGAMFWNVSSTANLDPGYYAYTRNLEAQLGRRFAGIRKNYWPGSGEPEISSEIVVAYAAGRRWTYMNGKPDPQFPDTDALRWASVTAGVYDDQFTRLFEAVKADSRWSAANPFHYSFHHEQNVPSEQGGRIAGAPQDYPTAFRHVRSLMDSTGAHVSKGGNMLMCWTPSWLQVFHDGDVGWQGYPYDASHCDPWSPGDSTPPYDLMGADVYRREGFSFTADDMWTPVHEWAAKRGVAFFGGEVGIAHMPGAEGDIVRYLDQMQRLVDGWSTGGAGRCAALCWTSRQAKGGDYRLDADPTVLARYRQMANARLFEASVPPA